MWISRYFLLMLFYSALGWIYETTYRTIKDRKWNNRGFLYGPICPIYGVGAVTVTLLVEGLEQVGMDSLPVWAVFLISMFGSAVLEFVTSWTLEKLFHAVWWDYSRLPLNIQGRVSLFTSMAFGGAGVLIVYVLAPWAAKLAAWPSPLLSEALSLLFMAVLAADTTLTVSALTNFAIRVNRLEDSWNEHMDELVETAKIRVMAGRDRWKERLESMSHTSQLALRRVHEFRFPKIENDKLNAQLRQLRGRVRK